MTAAGEGFLDEYLTAFRRANPESTPPKIWYCGGGWYAFRTGPVTSSYRKKTIVEMTGRLKTRSAQPATP